MDLAILKERSVSPFNHDSFSLERAAISDVFVGLCSVGLRTTDAISPPTRDLSKWQ